MTQMNDVLQRLGNVERDVSSLKSDVAGIKERLTHMPTKHEIALIIGAGGAVLFGATWWVIGTYAESIIQSFAK